MRRRPNMTTVCTMIVLLAAAVGMGCGGNNSGSGSTCDTFTNYQATTSTQLSFATDIYPIMSNMATAGPGCGTAVACHGNPPSPIDSITNPMKYLQFVFSPADPAMTKAQLMMPSVNAPTMQRVVAGNVGQSFLAYKLAKDKSGLACVDNKCVAGASVGNNMPCGDLMPSVGTIADADRTKILDWIAQGAHD